MSNAFDQPREAIPLGPQLARADRFRALFAEGMTLVEEAAGYLDGPGREEARELSSSLADAYSAESMRLTSRLMQLASWLLIRRAVIDGRVPASDEAGSRSRVRLSLQERVSPPGTFLQLPLRLQRLTELSLRLQRRIMLLDSMVNRREQPAGSGAPGGVAQLEARLRSAYGSR